MRELALENLLAPAREKAKRARNATARQRYLRRARKIALRQLNRRYEIILSRRYQVACLFSSAGPLFSSTSLRLELDGYVCKLFYTLTNTCEIVGRFHSARRIPITCPWLIPIDSVSLYNIV